MAEKEKVTGTLFTLFDWFMKFVIVNVMWLVFNLPVIFFTLNILVANQFETMLLYVVVVLVLIPFVSFPATTAMFGVVREWVLKEEERYSVFEAFWLYYKENYKRSLLNGLLLTLFFIIWFVDVYFYYDKNFYLFILFVATGVALYIFTINLFSITVHYEMPFWKNFKTAFFVTAGSPVLFIILLLSSSVVLYLSLNIFMFLVPLVTGSFIAFISFSAFYMRYLKIVQATEAEK